MKRVLIVGYWYVDPSMGGVRLRRIARRLPQAGWDPILLTHPADPMDGVELPPNVQVEAVAAPDLTRLYARLRGLFRCSGPTSPLPGGKKEPTAKEIGFTSKINRWMMIPDKQAPWYRKALQRGREVVRRETIDAIFATLDPRTSILVASRLSRETGIPCILEYRDLWTGSPYYHVAQATALHGWIHKRLERRALRQARRVSAVCLGIAKYLTQQHAAVLQAPVELNYNFFDPDEYPPAAPRPEPRPFVVSYTGAMYGSRSPHQFFEGLRAFIDQQHLTPAQLRFRWAGSISGVAGLAEVLDRTGVRPYMDFLGQVPHREALGELVTSDTALLIQAPGDAIHIPGKLFEAMGARVPLLALANPCEVAEIIDRCRAGIVCPHTADSVAAALRSFYQRFERRERWEFNEPELHRFSAAAAVEKLAGLFEAASR